MKRLDHPHDRLRERTLIAPKELDALIERVKDMQLTAGKTYHYEWPDRGYAVIAPARKGSDLHVVKTVLAPRMKPPGEKVAGMYRAFFDELEKMGTLMFANAQPTEGLRVAAPPTPPSALPKPAPRLPMASARSSGSFIGKGSSVNLTPKQQTPSPLVRGRDLSLSEVGSEVRRRYGTRAPNLANSMATQADAAATQLRATGGAPENIRVKMGPSQGNAFNNSNHTLTASGSSAAVLGHEAGHAVDYAVHGGTPEFFGKRGVLRFSASGAIPSEVSATQRALQAGNLPPHEVAGILANTATYLENETPHLRKSLTNVYNRVRNPALSEKADAYEKAVEKQRSTHGYEFNEEKATKQQKLLNNLSDSRRGRNISSSNPFVSPVSDEARNATKAHVDLVAKELGNHFSPEHVNTYREHMHARLDNPSRASLRDFAPMSRAASPAGAASAAAPAAAAAVSAAEKGLPAWGTSLRNAFSKLVRRV